MYIINTINELKRKKALSNSYVKIKATDVLTSNTIQLCIVVIPLVNFLCSGALFLTLYTVCGFNFYFSIRFTIWFFCLFPFYIYFGTWLYDDLLENGRMVYFRIKHFFVFRKRGLRNLKKLSIECLELEKKILDIMHKHKDSLLQDESDQMIVKDRMVDSEQIEAKVQEISEFIASL